MLDPCCTFLFSVHFKAALLACPWLLAPSPRCRSRARTSLVPSVSLVHLTGSLWANSPLGLTCQEMRSSLAEAAARGGGIGKAALYQFRVGLIIFHFSKRQSFPTAPAVCVWWNKHLLGNSSLQVRAITHGTGVLSSESFYFSQIHGHVCK